MLKAIGQVCAALTLQFTKVCLIVLQGASLVALPAIANSAAKEKSSCLLCDQPIPAEATDQLLPFAADSCQNLAKAACIAPDGSSRYKNISQAVSTEMVSLATQALNEAAQKEGAAGYTDFLFFKLTQAGVRIRSNIPEATRAAIDTLSPYTYFQEDAVFESIALCKDEEKKIREVQYLTETDEAKLEELLARIDNLKNYTLPLRRALYNQNISYFMTDLNSACSSYQSLVSGNIPGIAASLNVNPQAVRLANLCKNKSELQETLLETYRQNGSKMVGTYSEFIEQNIDLLSIKLQSFYPSNPNTSTGPTARAEKLRSKVSTALTQAHLACYVPSATSFFHNFRSQVNSKLLMSKGAVESLINRLYTKKRFAQYSAMFNEVREEVKKAVSRVTQDQTKLAAILAAYDRLKFTWLAVPSEDSYVRDEQTGLMILKDDIEMENPSLAMAFAQIGYFININAFYQTDMKMGAHTTESRVTMMPSFFLFADRNPMGFVAVLGHEIAHKIGPRVSFLNGFDLRGDYKQLMSCLAQPDSIRMQLHQADESISDYYSAEVMSVLIGQLPEVRRAQAARASVGAFCYFGVESLASNYFSVDGNHPDSMLRVSGIYGGNPNFRKVLGCTEDSKKYRTCRF